MLASYRRYLRDIAIFRALERDFNKNRASTDVEREREKETTERNDVEIQVIPIKRARFWGALKPVHKVSFIKTARPELTLITRLFRPSSSRFPETILRTSHAYFAREATRLNACHAFENASFVRLDF